MTPFRPLVDRVWNAQREILMADPGLGSLDGFEIVIGPELEADFLTDPRVYDLELSGVLDRHGRTLFGMPYRLDRHLPRGWIALRQEIVT